MEVVDEAMMAVRAPITDQKDDWETPQYLYDALDREFGFTLDGAATSQNARCRDFCTEAIPVGTGWSDNRVFCNPPYSKIGAFVKAALASRSLTVLLLPVRTDNDWFRALHRSARVDIRPYRKRVAFISDGETLNSPPFATMVVVVEASA